MKRNLPNRMVFQWHITDQCNLRCKHCYQNDFKSEGVSFDNQIKILDEIHEFQKYRQDKLGRSITHINFTGGEPFTRKDFLDLLISAKRKIYSFGILSNGYLLPTDSLNKLKELKPSFIQISLEGNEKMNDQIRGKGSFAQSIKALKTYYRLGIPTIISFTANALNYHQFPDVVKIGRIFKAVKVWTDRYIPSDKNDPLTISTQQSQDLFSIILKEQKRSKFHVFSKTIISGNRALQFLKYGGPAYKCSAGKSLLAILPNGDILPCRRLPITVGNILNDNLTELYLDNSILQRLGEDTNECRDCYYSKSCNGGLKCLSYALLEDYQKKDPNCWI